MDILVLCRYRSNLFFVIREIDFNKQSMGRLDAKVSVFHFFNTYLPVELCEPYLPFGKREIDIAILGLDMLRLTPGLSRGCLVVVPRLTLDCSVVLVARRNPG